MTNNNINVNEKSVTRLINKIVLLERNNLNTRKRNDSQMVKEIKKLIEEEVQCCSNQ